MCTAARLDVAHGVEAVQLVEQLQHGALDLTLAAALRLVPLRADRINLVCGQGGQRRFRDDTF